MTLIWLTVVIVIGVGIVLLLIQQNNTRVAQASPGDIAKLDRTLFTLQIGDIVQYFDTDWIVIGKLHYDDRGFEWLEYLLEDGDRRCWLSVEEDDSVEVSLLEVTTQLEIGAQPPPRIDFANETYKLAEQGTAMMTREGTTLNRKAARCQYFDYRGPDRKVLSVEDWGGEIEVTVGEQISPTMLRLLPGSAGI